MIGASVKRTGRFVERPEEVKRDFRNALEDGIKAGTLIVRKELVREMSSPKGAHPFFGVTGGMPGIGVRTGHTRARLSPGGRVYRYGNRVTGAVGSPDAHVEFMEEGGTKSAPAGRYLRVPLAGAQTASGADRYQGTSIRDIQGAFLLRTMRGKLFAAVKTGGAIRFLYMLVKSVHIRKRGVFARVTDVVRPKVEQLVRARVYVATRRANA